MTASLIGCREKEARALEQLKTLNEQIKGFVKGDSHSIRENLDTQTGIYTVRITAKPTPIRWSVLIGEVLHNLRSSLDHLVWQLTLANRNSPPDPLPDKSPWRRITFPIHMTEARFRDLVDDPRRDPLWGVSATARTFIEGYQPFHGWQEGDPARDALWVLHELSNIDKHRLLHLTASYLQFLRLVSAPFKGASTVTPLFARGEGIFEDNAVLVQLLVDPPTLQMGMDYEVEINVAFDEGTAHVPGLPVAGALGKMGAAVHAVLQDAQPLIV